MKLQDRIVLVTGGARRIGRAIAMALSERGAHVAFSYRRSAAGARETLRALKRCGTQPMAMQADLSREADVRRLIEGVRRRYGRLDVLINSASSFEQTPYASLTSGQWDRSIAANLTGPFLCALYASRLMRLQRTGKIINIADWSGVRPYRDYLPYCVAKGGVITLTTALAKELAPRIQVNAIAPGPMLPPASMSATQRTRIARRVPLKRWGSPQDIANTVVFLIEGTDFMTGSVVFVDGGQSIA